MVSSSGRPSSSARARPSPLGRTLLERLVSRRHPAPPQRRCTAPPVVRYHVHRRWRSRCWTPAAQRPDRDRQIFWTYAFAILSALVLENYERYHTTTLSKKLHKNYKLIQNFQNGKNTRKFWAGCTRHCDGNGTYRWESVGKSKGSLRWKPPLTPIFCEKEARQRAKRLQETGAVPQTLAGQRAIRRPSSTS